MVCRSAFVLCTIIQLLPCGSTVRADDETAAAAPSAADVKRFEVKIRPVLIAKCVKCHGNEKQEGSLRLDTLQAMIDGGDSGPALTVGNAADSLLISALRYESLEMPPTGQLDESIVNDFRDWIDHGAAWPTDAPLRNEAGVITDEDRSWWAFQPVLDPKLPKYDAAPPHPIDRFVGSRLAAAEMRQAPRASKPILIRRLYFDLLGLPPSPAEIQQFVSDASSDAWARLVDRLLADPRYGQQWARHWLDVVRYAESDGWNQDAYRESMWRYRDYVVRSLNECVSYPQFVRQQLAGDELPDDTPENLAATGYLRLGIYEYNQRDARSHWNDVVNELTDVTGDAFLGIGMACARCHDHKFDPLLQRDYFQLRAFFEPLVWRDDRRYATRQQQAETEAQQRVWEKATTAIRAEIDALVQSYHDRKWQSTVDKFPLDIQACFHKPQTDRSSWEHQMAYLVERQFEEEGGGPLKAMTKDDRARYDALQEQLSEFDHLKPLPLPSILTAADFEGTISPTRIPDAPDESDILPASLTVLKQTVTASVPTTRSDASTGRRTALAKWIADDRNPLTSRVIVNRVWQYHFGAGLCENSNDFGRRGTPPSHPQLLDWLTTRFIESGWDFKYLHRLILTSATWQMSAEHPDAARHQQLDAAERLLWRARVRRRTAEQIRDAMLATTGALDTRLDGPSEDGKTRRRSLYIQIKRNSLDPMLSAFDVANGLKSVSQRGQTTTPLQALLMINGDFALKASKQWVSRLHQECKSCGDAVETATWLAWGRAPTDQELKDVLAFLGATHNQPVQQADRERWIDYCHVMFNSNEFLYVD